MWRCGIGGFRGGGGGEAGGDEGVAERVHEVEESGGAVRIPPGGG